MKEAFPNAVRLSIHPGNATYKIPIAIMPRANGARAMTPWHSTLLCKVNGDFVPIRHADVHQDLRYELVYRNGRPWCYREVSPLLSMGDLDVSIDYLYPCGVVIQANRSTSIAAIDMYRIRSLAEACSPVILRGFAGTSHRELFLAKSRQMGPIMPWKFGELLEVKDAGENSQGLNNVLSNEPMPYHYDGLFKMVDGKSTPPRYVEFMLRFAQSDMSRFQVFTAVTPGTRHKGHTLFAPSNLIFRHLPAPHTAESLRPLTWAVSTQSFQATSMTGLPLVVEHPTTGLPNLRYHEDWPQERTKFDPTQVRIDGVAEDVDRGVRTAIEQTLYDRRVALRMSWQQGDMLINDNIAAMHTREGYNGDEPRELWRVHVD